MNAPGGYWIMSPDGRGVPYIQRKSLKIVESADVLIVSDGLYRLVDVYGAYSLESFFSTAFSNVGLPYLLKQLRRIEEQDDDAIRFPRVKLKDDASGISLRITI